jgi:hypothetical protein
MPRSTPAHRGGHEPNSAVLQGQRVNCEPAMSVLPRSSLDTVTHDLYPVQSAVFLSTLRDNPAPADDAVFGCLGVVNLRSRLRPPFSNRHGYLGSCVTVFPLSASVADVAGLDAAEQLYTLALLMKKEYERQKACVGLLGTSDAVIGQLIAAARARSSVLSARHANANAEDL